MPDMKVRTWSRSRSGCCISTGFTPRSGRVASAEWIDPCSAPSNSVAIRQSIRDRIASKYPCTR
jgi:hypothetical protein